MGKKILFTVTTDIRHDQRMQRIATSLAQAGHEVTVLGRELPSSQPLPSKLFQQFRLPCYFLKGPLFYFEFNVRLFWYILHQRPDILGVIDADTALAGVLVSKWWNIPMVFDAHELFPEMPEVVHRPLVKQVWSCIEKVAFQQAIQAYTVSNTLAEYFQGRYHQPVQVIRNMPFKIQASPKPVESVYFIYQGALNVGRGLECVLNAMPNIQAKLLICGTGPLEEALKKQVVHLGLQTKVEFRGNVAPEKLVTLTQGARAGIMLLEQTGLSYYYSLANKFFDYVQAGIPQVCIDFPEYIALNAEHEVALVTSLTVPEVEKALQQLLLDAPLYQRLQQNCLVARECWNWESESERLVKVYSQL